MLLCATLAFSSLYLYFEQIIMTVLFLYFIFLSEVSLTSTCMAIVGQKCAHASTKKSVDRWLPTSTNFTSPWKTLFVRTT